MPPARHSVQRTRRKPCSSRHTFVIPKAAAAIHVQENAGAGSLRLNDADLKRIDATFPRGKPRRGLPMI
jgi:diketogulonate reductase-like aldo/keto reductase